MIKIIDESLKMWLSLLFGLICFLASYIIFLPYLILKGEFEIHYKRTMDGIFYIMDWIYQDK